MVVIICAMLAVGAIGFTLLVRERDIPPAPVENPELKHLGTRRQVLYENLKDLQFEYLQGKLSDEDYQSLKGKFLYDLAAVMDAIERLQPAEERKGKRSTPPGLATKEHSKPKHAAVENVSRSCPACSKENPSANRFCGYCGAALTQ